MEALAIHSYFHGEILEVWKTLISVRVNFEKAKKVDWGGFGGHAHPQLLLADIYL